MDSSQPDIISDARLAAEFHEHGAARCRMAADEVMGSVKVARLRDMPQEKRFEFLAVLRRHLGTQGTVLDTKQCGQEDKPASELRQHERPEQQNAVAAVIDAQLISNGYEPLALMGKRALGNGWTSRPNTIEAIVAERASLPNATNTGARTGRLSVTDIDLVPPEHAAAAKALAFRVLGETQLERVGSKGMGLCFRNEMPIGKITVSGVHNTLTQVYKSETVPLMGKVEILGSGQQLAIYGDHPDTGKPYTWPNAALGGEPLKTKLVDVPEATPATLRDFAHEVKKLMKELGYRNVTVTGDIDDKRASAAAAESTDVPKQKKTKERGVTGGQVLEMLSFIDPRFNGIAPANFDAKKFGGEFGWGMNEWAGIARMTWNEEMPLVGDGAEDFDGPSKCFDWSSGKLWHERTGEKFTTSCPETIDDMDRRLAGEAGGVPYTVGTLIKLARACGYDGSVGIPAVYVFEIGSDIELARRLRTDLENDHRSTLVHAEGDFYQYEGKRWAPIDETDLRKQVHRYDGMLYGNDQRIIRLTQSRISSVLHEAAAMVEQSRFFDAAAMGINCTSGFITFDKKGAPTLDPHDPQHRARHVIPATWQPTMDLSWEAPLLSQLFDGCFRDDPDKEKRIDLIGEICGAVAMGLAPSMLKQPKAFILYGKHANNGKSQTEDLIRGLVPKEAVASVNPSQFDHDAYRLKLRGKLLNTASELGNARTISSEAFKYLVTGDAMTVNVKYQDAVEFRARAVHVFATNVLPPFQGGMDRGVRRRLIVMNFSHVFAPHEMIEGIGQRIASEEADALLAFAVAGASRLLAQGKYTEPPSCVAALREWMLASDPAIAWIECRTEQAKGHNVLQRDLYADFVRWAQHEGFDARHLPAINNFVARIQAHDPTLSTHRVGKGGKGGRVLRGLKLLADDLGDTESEELPEQEPDTF